MNLQELQALKAENPDWAWLDLTLEQVGTVEVGGEYEPAAWHDGRLCSSDFAVGAVLLKRADGDIADLSLVISLRVHKDLIEQARDCLDRMFRVAHYQAQAEAAMVHA
jgi:hypothetical protein